MTATVIDHALTAFHQFEYQGWESVSDVYDACWGALTGAFAAPLLDALGEVEGLRVLDVATGPGYVAGEAARRGAAATGVDFSPQMVARARTLHPAARFETGDAHRLPFAAASFDAVAINFGVQHFADLDAAFAEMARVLRPGGRIAFTIWADRADNLGADVLLNALDAHAEVDDDAPVGPDYGVLRAPGARGELLTAHDFIPDSGAPALRVARWRTPDPDFLYRAEIAGSVRSGERLRRQSPAAAERIRQHMMQEITRRFADGDGAIIPMAALVAAATRATAC